MVSVATKKPHQLKAKEVKSLRTYIHKKQGLKCLICKKYTNKPVLDHHHKKRVKGTGQVRGVLCPTCNVFLAKSENNCKRYLISNEELSAILRNMADYLDKKQYPYLHPSEAPPIPKLMVKSYNKLKKALMGTGVKCPVINIDRLKDKKQTLTKPLERAFSQAGLKPEFYKK